MKCSFPTPTITLIEAIEANDLKQVQRHFVQGMSIDDLLLCDRETERAETIKKTLRYQPFDDRIFRFLARMGLGTGIINHLLLTFSREGNVNACKILFATGADIHTKAGFFFGYTPLHYAAASGHIDVCKFLIESGANIYATNGLDQTPLHLASEKGHVDACKLLIESGAEIHTDYGSTVFSTSNDVLLEGYKVQIEAGQESYMKGKRGTPLHLAAEKGYVDVCQILLEAGADLHAKNRKGFTPLHLAAQNGHIEVCKLLLEAGANQYITDINGLTPLHYAAKGGHETYLFLLESEEHYAEKIKNDCCFWYSIATGDTSLCKAAIEAGVDIHTEDQLDTPLCYAAKRGHAGICQTLIDNGADIHATNGLGLTPLHCAAGKGHIDVCQVLIGAGTSVCSKDHWSPIHNAANAGYAEVCKTLITAGADIHVDTGTGTPLHLAAQKGHVETCKVLIAAGANIHAQNREGNTPLHCAASCIEGESEKVCKILIESGADIHARNNHNDTPLHLAVCKIATFNFLITAGADTGVRNKKGQTALDRRLEYFDIVETYRFIADRCTELMAGYKNPHFYTDWIIDRQFYDTDDLTFLFSGVPGKLKGLPQLKVGFDALGTYGFGLKYFISKLDTKIKEYCKRTSQEIERYFEEKRERQTELVLSAMNKNWC